MDHITQPYSLFTAYDIDLFKAGRHFRLYEKLGAHIIDSEEHKGVYFAVWAPNAKSVNLTGDFNNWNGENYPLYPRWDNSGIWEGLVPNIQMGHRYKYHITSINEVDTFKGDPFALLWEAPPNTASMLTNPKFQWTDDQWIRNRGDIPFPERPISIYEVHLGSWRRTQEGTRLNYQELAAILPEYCQYMGFTHVELMPVTEHPFYGSWGYQTTGYFAPSARYGTPEDFMALINRLHETNIGVIIDWVPSHFPTDAHGLGLFDGTHLYEHEDPKKGFHPDWKSYIFNYSRNEVRAFLISNALFWLDRYHIDGIRVDAVASMLYLDYSREPGEWIPNEYGGRENLDAIHFLKELNDAVHQHYPDVFTVAEESTAWPGVTLATNQGGLGFDLKWMMGWMNDTLRYFQMDPIYRSFHHGTLSFSIHYAFSERFCLPLSHDEVVHGKKSLLRKMPGDEWQQFANLRLLFSYMFTHPGSKLLFMGSEFGQQHEWRHDFSLDWHENEGHQQRGIQQLVRKLNELYQNEPSLNELNYAPDGFEWIDFQDSQHSVLVWKRKAADPEDFLIIIANFTSIPRNNYRIGAPEGNYKELFNSDDNEYGGSGLKNKQKQAFPIAKHGHTHSLSISLPPLGLLILQPLHKTND